MLRSYTDDPQYSPDQIKIQPQAIIVFSEWLYLVSRVYTTTKNLKDPLAPPYLLQVWTKEG